MEPVEGTQLFTLPYCNEDASAFLTQIIFNLTDIMLCYFKEEHSMDYFILQKTCSFAYEYDVASSRREIINFDNGHALPVRWWTFKRAMIKRFTIPILPYTGFEVLMKFCLTIFKLLHTTEIEDFWKTSKVHTTGHTTECQPPATGS